MGERDVGWSGCAVVLGLWIATACGASRAERAVDAPVGSPEVGGSAAEPGSAERGASAGWEGSAGSDAAAVVDRSEARRRVMALPEVAAFLARYAPCEGCRFPVPRNPPEHEGCVDVSVREVRRDGRPAWVVELAVSAACSFRLNPSTRPVAVTLDRAEGTVLGMEPEPAVTADPAACSEDAACRCLSGSGVPFVGCANAFHAAMHFAGNWACDRCGCLEGRCVEVE